MSIVPIAPQPEQDRFITVTAAIDAWAVYFWHDDGELTCSRERVLAYGINQGGDVIALVGADGDALRAASWARRVPTSIEVRGTDDFQACECLTPLTNVHDPLFCQECCGVVRDAA